MSFDIKRGDTAPSFKTQLRDRTGSLVTLSSVNRVSFYMRDSNYNIIVSDDTNGNVSVADEATGKVKYTWKPNDTDNTGLYAAEFEVEFADGTIRTFPHNTTYDIKVVEDIND